VRYGLYLPVKSEQASSALLLPGVETEKYCQLFCVFRWGLVSWKGNCGFWVPVSVPAGKRGQEMSPVSGGDHRKDRSL
jgi:hypothetical protein